MSRDEQQALEDRILDSLGVNTPKKRKLVKDEPVAVAQRSHAGTTWEKPADVSTPSIQSATTNREQQGGLTAEVQSTPARPGTVVRIGGDKPYTKEINDDQETGRLFLRYRYTKDGEEYIYERTVNTQGKSDKEKQRIIRDTEKELGLPSTQ